MHVLITTHGSIMAPGVPHSVISLQQPECLPVSTVMSGSHCLNHFRMAATLHGSIKHAFWHDVWTNATHDDCDFAIAHMLVWQAMHMESEAEWPFQGQNLYSLLVMGLVPFVLQSLPFHAHNKVGEGQAREADATAECWLELYNPIEDSKHAPSPSDVFLTAVHRNMVQVSHLIISNLPSSDVKHFQQFWVMARSLFLDEYKC